MPKPCQCNRWGSGTCGPTASKEPQSKEMKSKLEQMMAERNRQDGMWSQPTNDPKYIQEKGLQTNAKPRD
jgi:hypothetical protein